jgi:hypothetical protein
VPLTVNAATAACGVLTRDGKMRRKFGDKVIAENGVSIIARNV